MLERILNDTHARTSEPNSFSVGPVSVHALILPPSHHPLPVHHHAAGRSCSDAPCVPLPLIPPPPYHHFPVRLNVLLPLIAQDPEPLCVPLLQHPLSGLQLLLSELRSLLGSSLSNRVGEVRVTSNQGVGGSGNGAVCACG